MRNFDKESAIIDYINGHMQPSSKHVFETALAEDTDLAKRLQQAIALKDGVRQQVVNDRVNPSFDAFSHKLEKTTPWYAKWYNWLPMPAAALVVFLTVTPQSEVNEFETLTSASQSYSVPAVRLIGASNTNLLAIAEEYELKILTQYTGTNAIDVTHADNLPALITRLQQDSRLVLIKPLGE